MKFALDTAVDVAVVTESSLHILVIELKPSYRHLVGAGGNLITVKGEAEAYIESKRKSVKALV